MTYFILRSNGLIITKYDVHIANSLQDIGHADLHFITHKSMSQGLAMSDQISA